MRLIDADALKENVKYQAEICRLLNNDAMREYANMMEFGFCKEIDNAPTIDSQQKWISVSEMLPSDCGFDWVLAQIQADNGYLWIPQVMEYRKAKDDWYSNNDHLGWLKDHNGVFKVVAWIPLPKPYEENKL